MNNSMEESLPPGFRFHPTDEELITYYLNNKIADRGFTCRAVAVVDLNKCEPWDLPALATMGEKEWYFFNLKDRKYPTGLRTNRATRVGYWKTTGKDKEIYRGGNIVGMKKTLVFYRGRAPKGEKSNWVMHEYRPQAKPTFKSNKDEWVVCRVFKKSSSAVKKPCQSPSSSQQYTTLEESPTRTSTMFGDSSKIPTDRDVPNGLENSRMSSSNRYYNCGTSTDDQISNGAMSPQNMYNISSMKMDTDQSLQWNTGATFSNGSLQNSSNVAFNSLLLKALQLRNTYSQPSPFTSQTLMTSDDYSPVLNNIPTQNIARNNASSAYGMGFNGNMVATAAASSSSSHHQQQQLHGILDEGQEQQAFSLDSIW